MSSGGAVDPSLGPVAPRPSRRGRGLGSGRTVTLVLFVTVLTLLSGVLPARAASSSALAASPRLGEPGTAAGVAEPSNLAAAKASLAVASNTSGWTNVAYGDGPSSMLGSVLLTDDARDGYPFLMATLNGSGYPGPAAYLRFQNGVWTDLSVTSGPGYCPGSALGYDSTDAVVVYVPGLGCPTSGTTWTYQGGAWTNRTTSVHPAPRSVAQVADDPSDGYLLLFGGAHRTPAQVSSDLFNDTWTYSNGTWTNRTVSGATAPSGRYGGTIAFDSTDSEVVLLGGHTLGTGYLSGNDTWTYHAGVWTSVPTAGPTLPSAQTLGPVAIADDPAGLGVLAVLSANTSHNASSPAWFPWLWVYSAGGWSTLNATGIPPSVVSAFAAYDAQLGSVLLLSPGTTGTPPTTFLYSGTTWTNETPLVPAPRFGAAMTYDAADGYDLLFGGFGPGTYPYLESPLSDTWSFHAGGWTKLTTNATPPASGAQGLVYDASDGYTLLFGVPTATGDDNATWEFTNGGWTQITPNVSPPPYNDGSQLVYDGADGYVLLLSHWWGTVTTWTYHAGVWTNLSAQGVASPGRPANPLVYDSTDGSVVLFGTILSTLYYGALSEETWTFQGGNWTNQTARVAGAPGGRSGAAIVDDPAEGGVLLFGGSGQPGAPGFRTTNDTWFYGNRTWTHWFTSVAPVPRSDASVAYDPADGTIVLFGGADVGSFQQPPACTITPYYASFCEDTWVWSSAALTSPALESFTANPPTVDVGTMTTFTTVVRGGTTPYAYSYGGLPPGCGSQNASTWACVPTVVGRYNVSVTVVDASGNSTGGTAPLTVVDRPSIQAFFAVPAAVDVGERTLLSVQASGGTGSISYRYVGLPPGCASQTVPTLPCSPTSAGNYTVNVTASDAVGAWVSASLALPVASLGSGSGPFLTGFSFVPGALVLGNATTISVNASGGIGFLSYRYTGLPPGCTGVNASSMACAPTAAGIFDVSISVADATGTVVSVSGNLTVYPIGGGAGATISAFSAAPSAFDLGGSTVLVVLASGGTGPLSYAYPALPPGCVSANVSSLPCSPTVAGNFTVYVLVTDSAGHRVGALGRLGVGAVSIGPAPSISLFVAAPSSVTVNHTTTLFLTVAGGSAPFSYRYDGLPPGCATEDRVPLNCTPNEVGNYSVRATVTDAAGRTTAATAGLEVVPGPARPPSGGEATAPAFVLVGSAYLLAGVVGGGVIAWVLAGPVLARHRARREGEALVRAMNREIESHDPDDPKGP